MLDCLRVFGVFLLAARRGTAALWEAFINFRPVDWRPVAETADRIAREADPSRCVLALLAVLLAGLAGLFLWAGFSEEETWIFNFLGLEPEEKSEALTFLGLAMGGVLVAIGAVIAHRRARALEETARAQARAAEQQARANDNAEKGQLQDRLKNAIEHLGHGSPTVRAGGALELERLARDAPELREMAHEILYGHERRDAGGAEDGDGDS